MPKALNLKGQVFTNLKVLEKAPNKNQKTYWTCECLLCGSVRDYQTGHLTSGASKSCGCKKSKNFNISQVEINKECKICGTLFATHSHNRLYCYNCSPEQLVVNSAEYQKARKRAVKHQLVLYKGGKCIKCGYDKCEGSLQFHHRNPQEKSFTLSAINVSKELDMEELYREVDKCDLLCANCHGEIHFNE